MEKQFRRVLLSADDGNFSTQQFSGPLLREATRIFSTLFPGFKASKVLTRSRLDSTVEVRIPFVFQEFEIPRYGILVYNIQIAPFVKVSFNPFSSQPRPEDPNGIDWTKLLYVEARHEFYALEPLLIAAFSVDYSKESSVSEKS